MVCPKFLGRQGGTGGISPGLPQIPKIWDAPVKMLPMKLMSQFIFKPNNYSPARLLIVDDEADIRLAIARVLELEGFLVALAASGQEALQLLKKDNYDLMVLDMHLPGLNGVEVMRQARQLCPNLLIVVLTGYATLENAIAAIKLDAVDYLKKPAKLEQIVAAVIQALQKQAKQLCQQQLTHKLTATLKTLNQTESAGSNGHTQADVPQDLLRVGPITLNHHKRIATVESTPPRHVELTQSEMEVLTSLVSRPNQVVSCKALVYHTWGYTIDEKEAQSLVRPYIFRLRSKLEVDNKKPRLIQTIRKRGYMFVGTPEKQRQNVSQNGHDPLLIEAPTFRR